MILIDFSAIAYQSMYGAISTVEPNTDDNGKYFTKEFAPYMVYKILSGIFDAQQRFSNCGDVVLCLDGEGSKNWRKAVYPMYKSSRPIQRQESPINFNEVFDALNNLIETLTRYSPYKVVKVSEAEGDDAIMVLAKELPGPTMIISSDKDIIQMQRYPGIKQYSPITQSFVTYETKREDSMDDWLLEHVVLGDATDDVPRIVDGLEFTETFKKFLDLNNIKTDPLTVRNDNWFKWSEQGFAECRKNSIVPDIFVRPRFGIATARKAIKIYGSLDAWLDTDPRLRQNYELNRTLVLEEGIPESVRDGIKAAYNNAPDEVDTKKFEEYLDGLGISRMMLALPNNFNRKFSVEDLF